MIRQAHISTIVMNLASWFAAPKKAFVWLNIMKAEKGREKYAEHTEIMTFLLSFITKPRLMSHSILCSAAYVYRCVLRVRTRNSCVKIHDIKLI